MKLDSLQISNKIALNSRHPWVLAESTRKGICFQSSTKKFKFSSLFDDVFPISGISLGIRNLLNRSKAFWWLEQFNSEGCVFNKAIEQLMPQKPEVPNIWDAYDRIFTMLMRKIAAIYYSTSGNHIKSAWTCQEPGSSEWESVNNNIDNKITIIRTLAPTHREASCWLTEGCWSNWFVLWSITDFPRGLNKFNAIKVISWIFENSVLLSLTVCEYMLCTEESPLDLKLVKMRISIHQLSQDVRAPLDARRGSAEGRNSDSRRIFLRC